MKRCRACTTRATGAVECELLAGHAGSHQGKHTENGETSQATWNNPNAPYFEATEPATRLPPPPALPSIGAPPVELESDHPTHPDEAIGRQRRAATHCACGTEHTGDDRELRVGASGLPLAATMLGDTEPDHQFSWARVCIGCGAVYCRIWSGESIAPRVRSCTCSLVQRQRAEFVHAVDCPQSGYHLG